MLLEPIIGIKNELKHLQDKKSEKYLKMFHFLIYKILQNEHLTQLVF